MLMLSSLRILFLVDVGGVFSIGDGSKALAGVLCVLLVMFVRFSIIAYRLRDVNAKRV